MMTESEIRARVQQMVDEDPRGPQAEALLRRMVAFHGPLTPRLVTLFAPKEMSRQDRMDTFTTLDTWGFLFRRFKSADWRYQPEKLLFFRPEVIAAIPIDTTAYSILFQYIQQPTPDPWAFRRYQLVYRAEWLDALDGAFSKDRDQGLRFFMALSPFKLGEGPAPAIAAEIIRRYQDAETRIQALLYFAALVEDYDLPWVSQERLNVFAERDRHTESLRDFLERTAALSLSPVERSFVDQLYERSVTLFARRGWINVSVLLRLGAIRLRQGDRAQALIDFEAAIRAHRGQSFQSNPLGTAQDAARLGDIELTRFFYSRLYLIHNRSDVLWHWGCMEYQQGARVEGIGLCRIALHEWKRQMDQQPRSNPSRTLRREWRLKYNQLMAMERAADESHPSS